MSAWEVGQKVILRDVNQDRRWWPDGNPPMGTITKVGRTLVHIADDRYPGGPSQPYRMDDGSANNDWGHAWIQSLDAFQDEQQRAILLARIRDAKVNLGYSHSLTIDQLARIADIVEER